MTRIMVVDDHPVVREGIVAALSADDDFEVAADAASSEEALQLARSSARTEALVAVASGFAAHSRGATRPRRRHLRSPAKAIPHPAHIRER